MNYLEFLDADVISELGRNFARTTSLRGVGIIMNHSLVNLSHLSQRMLFKIKEYGGEIDANVVFFESRSVPPGLRHTYPSRSRCKIFVPRLHRKHPNPDSRHPERQTF